MKIITKNTDYAIRALCAIAKDNIIISASKIAKKEKIPLPYLHRVLNKLKKEKIIESKEGKNGGVKLVKEPSDIKVSDMVRLFQGEIQISQCIFRKNLCPNRKKCLLRKKLKKIENSLIKELDKITIETLTKDREEK
ncbi:MAG: Rrf2 family transcriptional regulator [Candidatus Omnitrophica bacterium]|nr:Rrf2 family transcriptional regulator [Candidatus Omnitrophota bacterium]MCM8816582.1 Rrf2 family transcriptional regulator [Candidatus Omnitrophota bacterium]